LHTFLEVGLALMAIRNSRLYRDGYPTFDAYLQHRWPELSSRRAYQLMEAASVVQHVNQGSMNQGSIPTSERHVRPLVKLDPDEQRAAWQQVVETAPHGKITAAHVQRVVDQRQPRAVPAAALFPGPATHPELERVATYHLLEAALALLTTDLGTHRPAMTMSHVQVQEAARLLLESPTLKGAAAMLAASIPWDA
jgi:hypothetical protein